jgi:GTP-binding protein LepA
VSETESIRNFCIIAHIDHGKSTLADRLLEFTGTVPKRELREQMLDSMELERERGITIKSKAVKIAYRAQDGREYSLNLIDTPGHVDFSYEVSRSLAACEGAVLVVDAVQGVEAQTLANAYLAVDHGLDIVVVINKIDLPNARIDEVERQVREIVGLKDEEILIASAKEGTGTQDILEAVVRDIHPPSGDPDAPLRALIFDSTFSTYRGVVVYVRVCDGSMQAGDRMRLMAKGQSYEIEEVGVFVPKPKLVERLQPGDVGYVMANIRKLSDVRIGDTITSTDNSASEPLPGYEEVRPVVFCGMYPAAAQEYETLRNAMQRLALNDSSFTHEPEVSAALGFGFRLGFLGLLHMEIVQERLEREYDLSIVTTAPSVRYKTRTKAGDTVYVDNPSKMPPAAEIESIAEPLISADMIVPAEYVGNVLELCERRRGIHEKIEYIDENKVLVIYKLPLAEVVMDFYDKLKSATRGYGSFDYRFIGYVEGDLVRVDMLLNGEPVDALSTIVHRTKAERTGREFATKLRTIIPRQLFEVVIQAVIGSRIIVRESIKPLRKNVTAKCYGGDITRKRKLLKKQKEGKKRMKRVGRVDVPQEAFMAVLRTD